MKLSELMHNVEKRLPLSLQEKWDHGGLNLGDCHSEIRSILFAYDVCHEVIDEARRKKCGLIVSHHPFRLSADVNIDVGSYEGQIIAQCITHKTALYSCHTHHDASADSLNFSYLKKMGVKNPQPMAHAAQKLYKLVTPIPKTHTAHVMDALFAAGAGHVGAYSECSFRSSGTGTFKGDTTTNPSIGKKLQRENVSEDRLEVIVTQDALSSAIVSLKKAHPYEEVAYDVLELQNQRGDVGLGAYGTLEKTVVLKNFLSTLKKVFATPNLRFVASRKEKISRIGICTGSGASFIDKAIDLKLDLFITGDVKYHQAIHAKRAGLALADVGHFYSEKNSVSVLKNIFAEVLGKKITLFEYTKLKDAFDFV